MDRARWDDSKTPPLVLIGRGGVEKCPIMWIEVSVVVLMWLIILSMDRACSHLSKTPIGFLITTATSRESDVGVLLPVPVVLLLLWEGGNRVVVVVVVVVVEVLFGRLYCVLLVVGWVLLWYYCGVLSMMEIIQQSTSRDNSTSACELSSSSSLTTTNNHLIIDHPTSSIHWWRQKFRCKIATTHLLLLCQLWCSATKFRCCCRCCHN
jgi:hypothetical protein